MRAPLILGTDLAIWAFMILVAVRLDETKAEIFEFPTLQKAEGFLIEFQRKYGKVDYSISNGRNRRKKNPPEQIQLKLAV